jgi:hypothetical protein
MIEFAKKFFAKATAKVIATQELEEAKRRLLVSQAQAEYHNRMVQYYGDMIRRLTIYIKSEEV